MCQGGRLQAGPPDELQNLNFAGQVGSSQGWTGPLVLTRLIQETGWRFKLSRRTVSPFLRVWCIGKVGFKQDRSTTCQVSIDFGQAESLYGNTALPGLQWWLALMWLRRCFRSGHRNKACQAHYEVLLVSLNEESGSGRSVLLRAEPYRSICLLTGRSG